MSTAHACLYSSADYPEAEAPRHRAPEAATHAAERPNRPQDGPQDERSFGRLRETKTLPDGVAIPKPGLGTWMIDDNRGAVAPGYRNIDTAQAYGIERGVGIVIRDCGVPREELCV
ncbi:hypothetical protein [uncultured Salipiger sp.]|uniref:hypothetical protein n=1 Tax=uncultured Salipiger sp. TaxID=499810 RepID=UPI002591DE81|nr:hypothetical protein [uncultured Salipiger sp.]